MPANTQRQQEGAKMLVLLHEVQQLQDMIASPSCSGLNRILFQARRFALIDQLQAMKQENMVLA